MSSPYGLIYAKNPPWEVLQFIMAVRQPTKEQKNEPRPAARLIYLAAMSRHTDTIVLLKAECSFLICGLPKQNKADVPKRL